VSKRPKSRETAIARTPRLQVTNLEGLKLDGKNANRGTARGAEMLDRSLADYLPDSRYKTQEANKSA
jgi:hypothetical protein